jgi:tetratricopeptide (TPR) repeat protein
MNNYTDIILKYRLGEMTIAERGQFNHILCLNLQLRKEFIFHEKLDNIMKKSLMLEAIESDPNLIKAEILACRDIDTYLNKDGERVNNKDNNIFEVETEVELRKKIAKAQVEMVLSGIDDISESWVKNFEKSKAFIGQDSAAQRIIKYVKQSEPFKETVIQMPSLRYRITRKIGIQVAAAVFVLSLLLFKSLTPSLTGDAVYKRYYSPMEANSYSLRGNSQDAGTKFQEGIDYYLQKDYAKADLAFNDLRLKNENAPEILLYAGLNKMGQGHFASAIKLFSDLLSTGDQFVPEAQWYLGLCYIKTGENLKARSLMESLSETEGIYMKKAQVILKNLNQ